ncbi:MAG: hypothetical protein IJ745_05065 [Bacteroidales bacterium]|nr:hypothetical protein [Bacteroidales bacterium]
MNEQQIEQLIAERRCILQREDDEHLRHLADGLGDGLPGWILRRRIAASACSMALVVALTMAYSAILPSRASTPPVACNLAGQEQAIVDCATNLLT